MTARTFDLVLLNGRQSTRLSGLTHLIAADASGQFGIQAAHEPLVTVLEPGLFRHRAGETNRWRHAACTGGLLHCLRDGTGDTIVRIVSERFLQSDDPDELQQQLDALLAKEQALRLSTLESVSRLDLAFYKRMQELAQTAS